MPYSLQTIRSAADLSDAERDAIGFGNWEKLRP